MALRDRFFKKTLLNLIVILLSFVCGINISLFSPGIWVIILIMLALTLAFGLYGVLFSHAWQRHFLTYIPKRRIYLMIMAQIFIFVPWRLRSIDEVMKSSQMSLFGLDFVRIVKLVVMLAIFIITLPSFVKFVRNLKDLRSCSMERAVFFLFLLSIVFILLRMIFSLDFRLYNYYVPFQSYISLASLIWITDFKNFSENQKDFIYKTIIASATIFISVMLLLYLFDRELVFTVSPTTGIGRLGGVIISPNSLSAFAAVVLIYNFARIITKSYSIKEYVFLLLASYVLILARSTAAIIEVFGVILILLFIKRRFIALNFAMTVIIMICSIYFNDVVKFLLKVPSIQAYLTESTFIARVYLWKNSIEKLFSMDTIYPFIGVGFGLNSFAFFYDLDYWHPNFAHNVFVQKLVEGGIVYLALLLLFVFLLIISICKSRKVTKESLYLFLVGVFIYTFANSLGGDGFFGYVGITTYILLYFIISTLRRAMYENFAQKRFEVYHSANSSRP